MFVVGGVAIQEEGDSEKAPDDEATAERRIGCKPLEQTMIDSFVLSLSIQFDSRFNVCYDNNCIVMIDGHRRRSSAEK